MRKKSFIAIFLTLISALFLLCACEKVEDMGSLQDFSKPYVGEYVCRKLSVGGEDFTERFDYVKLNLSYGGEYKLFYRDIEGMSGEYSGKYSVSPKEQEITLSSQAGLRTVTRTFPMKNGTICIDLNLEGKLLHAEFAFPE